MHLIRARMNQMESIDVKTEKIENVQTEKVVKSQTEKSENALPEIVSQSPASTEPDNSPVMEENIVEHVAAVSSAEKSSSVLTITEADKSRPVASFTVADTVSYRMSGTLTTHTLAEGESLVRLSTLYYGTKVLWPYIAAYNRISDPNNVQVGMKLRIPALANR